MGGSHLENSPWAPPKASKNPPRAPPIMGVSHSKSENFAPPHYGGEHQKFPGRKSPRDSPPFWGWAKKISPAAPKIHRFPKFSTRFACKIPSIYPQNTQKVSRFARESTKIPVYPWNINKKSRASRVKHTLWYQRILTLLRENDTNWQFALKIRNKRFREAWRKFWAFKGDFDKFPREARRFFLNFWG